MALVEFETHGKVALIRLNRPAMRNAVNLEMTAALRACLSQFETDPAIAVAVLTGAGQFFCAGMDLGAFAAGERPGLNDPDRFAGFVGARRTKPIIAAVNGGAVAGGFEIALACDMIVAEDKAFFSLPEVKRGIIAAGGGAIRLPRRLPPAIAKEMLLTGDPIAAERAFQLGLVNALAPGEELVERAMALAARIAENAPMAVRLSLDLAEQAASSNESSLWSASDTAWSKVEKSADALEGAVAFKEKRPPRWSGR